MITFLFVALQNFLPIWGGMGQLHAQLSASEQSHSLRGEDLHHPLGLSRGTGGDLFKTNSSSDTFCSHCAGSWTDSDFLLSDIF